jgi:hypothetical protein
MKLSNDALGQFEIFLSQCKNDALKELCSAEEYSKKKNKQKEQRLQLESLISDEANALFIAFIETSIEIQAMEDDKLYMLGITVSSELGKIFHSETPEYKAFEKIFTTGSP